MKWLSGSRTKLKNRHGCCAHQRAGNGLPSVEIIREQIWLLPPFHTRA